MSFRQVAARAGRLLTCSLALCGFACVPAQAAEPPSGAVEYLEHPEDGPMSRSGRPLTSGGQALYGVDINSSIDLKIDTLKLQAALLGPDASAVAARARQLQNRLGLLRGAIQKVGAAARNLRTLLATWKPGDAAFERKQRESSNEREAILQALWDARRQRLVEMKRAPESDDDLFDAIVSGPDRIDGYNWTLVSRLLNEELREADADFQAIASQLQFGLEIQSHLISRSGQGAPVRLPGYNEAPSGAPKPHEKLQFAAEGQAEAFERYEQLARERGEAKNLGEAIFKQLEGELRLLRAQLDVVTQGAQDARDRLRDRLDSLEKWGSADERRAWLDKVAQDLKGSQQGRKVQETWEALEEALAELQRDIAALRALAGLRGQLSGRTAPEALDALLKTVGSLRDPQRRELRLLQAGAWEDRLQKIAEFTKAVEALQGPARDRIMAPQGPYGDLKAAHGAFRQFLDAVRQSAGAVSQWIDKLIQSAPAYAAANLPLPPGHRRVPVLSGSQLSTRIDLQRIPAQREVGDTVRVQYELFQGETKLPGGWADEFSLRSYGWNSEVLASLAFTRQGSGSATWKPTAAMSWILSYSSWPDAGDNGLASSRLKWFSGAGVSVMPLESAGNEGVKLGLGATLAFLNNRLLAGIGTNLQATTDKRFVFFSIRLLDFPGLSGPLGGTGTQK